ncbi:MAG: hypothetical protein ACRD3O_20300 [Terriglobia bacterium]
MKRPLVDVNLMCQQLPKDAPEISQKILHVKSLKQTDAPKNIQAFRLRQVARSVIIEPHRICAKLLRQQDRAHLTRTEPIFSLGHAQAGRIRNCLYPDPSRFRHLRRSREAPTSHNNLVVNFAGNINTREKPIEQVKTAKLGQNNER